MKNLFTSIIKKNYLMLISLLMILLSACQNKYNYIEQVKITNIYNETSIKDEDAVVIKASSDSAAYLKAYEIYAMHQKFYHERLASGSKTLLQPLKFSIYDEKGTDITNISFATRSEKEDEIRDRISKLSGITTSSSTPKKGRLGDWEIGRYVNEFDEYTDKKYIKQISFGTFSNSATTNSRLEAIVLIDNDDIRFRLKEYMSHVVKDDEPMRLLVKSSDSIVSEFNMWADDDGYIEFLGLSSSQKEKDSLMNIFLRGGVIKFYGIIDRYSKSTYNFSFDADSLQNAIIDMNKAE